MQNDVFIDSHLIPGECESLRFSGDHLTFHIFHDHAKVPPCFKGAEHGDNKWVLCEGEDVPLHKRLLDLVPQDQILLVDLLHGKTLTCLSVAHQVDSPGKSSKQKKSLSCWLIKTANGHIQYFRCKDGH